MKTNLSRAVFFVLIEGCLFLNGTSFAQKQNLVEKISKQYSLMLKDAEMHNSNPRTITPDGITKWCGKSFDWTEGFFPGSCWYMYKLTNDKKWKEAGAKFQSLSRNHTNASSHDVGFVFFCSYGNAFNITNDSSYITVLKEAGNTLVKRFDPRVGAIKSWDVDKGWQSKRGWQYPVIIDNMMNLELLFELSNLTGDQKYRDIAIAHANTTDLNHFRKDGSSFHVVDYDSISGKVNHRQTAQGYADTSAWARGQAWGVYGYIVCYRYTHNKRYLNRAMDIARFIMNNNKIPADKIPYWDYDVPNKSEKIPRDVSAAAITASALLELKEYCGDKELSAAYVKYAKEILKSLETSKYLAAVGSNNYFLLKHSVGSIPHNSEIDVPLNYADYYFLEALIRMQNN